MAAVYLAWAVSAAILLLVAGWLGVTIQRGYFGILIDRRGRYSLTQFQLVLWTVVIVSLISGVFWGRLVAGVSDSLGFVIPNELLAVLGISVGSTAAATVIKTQKEMTNKTGVAASDPSAPPHFSQIFLAEEGPMANRIIDVAKYQNFWITLVLVVAYVALAVATIQKAASAGDLKSLPGFSQGFLTLLLISHAGYLAGKLPTPQGDAPGLNYDQLRQKSTVQTLAPPLQPRGQNSQDQPAGPAPAPAQP
jgi:hypothetical protein